MNLSQKIERITQVLADRRYHVLADENICRPSDYAFVLGRELDSYGLKLSVTPLNLIDDSIKSAVPVGATLVLDVPIVDREMNTVFHAAILFHQDSSLELRDLEP